jgi:hypothetical protein
MVNDISRQIGSILSIENNLSLFFAWDPVQPLASQAPGGSGEAYCQPSRLLVWIFLDALFPEPITPISP